MALACVACASCAAQENSFSMPEVIVFGASTAQMEDALQGQCKTINTRKIDPPFLPDIKDEQLQIDCDGFEFFGAPRWTEFVIGDGSLEMVWILTTEDDEAALRDAMTKVYGPPTHVSAAFEAFADNNAALRKDKPEVLFYSEKLAPGWESEFEKMAQAGE